MMFVQISWARVCHCGRTFDGKVVVETVQAMLLSAVSERLRMEEDGPEKIASRGVQERLESAG